VLATVLLRYMPHGPALGLALALACSRGASTGVRPAALAIAVFAVFALTLRALVPYRANVLVGPAVPTPALDTLRCEGMRLHVFNTGQACARSRIQASTTSCSETVSWQRAPVITCSMVRKTTWSAVKVWPA
jgi:hypothetical protein